MFCTKIRNCQDLTKLATVLVGVCVLLHRPDRTNTVLI
nr:MAG TPA: hypothetical protein [Caudoviricetes sp.]